MTLATGQVLQDRYRVVSMLGQGGMGAVYRAWDVRLDIPVALKEMRPQPGLDGRSLSQLRQQFHREATVLARLDHPHLVDVTDFFEEGGNAYLVMRFVEGESLAERIERQGALPEAQVLAWVGQLLDALEYCHAQGVIHRDVKPQNVIIRPDGRAVLVDFGLVKLWDPSDPRTRTAIRAMGTPEYAPPEQYDTAAGHTGPRSDLYSLGATLYHALSGRVPPTATMRVVDPAALTPVTAWSPRVSPHVEAVVKRAMELQPAARFESAREMAAALTGEAPPPEPQFVVPERQPTKVMPDARPAVAQRKRVPGWVWGVGGLAVLGLVLAIGVAAVLMLASPSLRGEAGEREDMPQQEEVVTGLTDTPRATSTPRPATTPVAEPTPELAAVPTTSAVSEGLNAVEYYGFNVARPPFDDPLVRQAFILALDRAALSDVMNEAIDSGDGYVPATSFTPPDVLGVDLYGKVGLTYDPDRARRLLAQAGYPDGAGLPPITLWYNETESGLFRHLSEAIQEQWQEVLGVKVSLQSKPWDEYTGAIAQNPPQVWRMGWVVDYVDPRNCLHDAICGGYNSDFYGNESEYEAAVEAIENAPDAARRRISIADFSERACEYWSPTRFRWENSEYTDLLARAFQESDENRRLELYVQAERILCQTDAVVIPLFHHHR
jgi:serine/threonine-protein kinase